MALAGTAILLKTVVLLIPSLVFVVIMNHSYISKEEAFLTEQFGADLTKYKKNVSV